MRSLRVGFAGTPEFAVPTLRALMVSRHDIVAVYTQPDRPAGRGQKICQSPVKKFAAEHGLAVLQPTSLKGVKVQHKLGNLQLDIMVVVAYGQILPTAVLNLPRYGCLNVHASLLPRWRGAAPIHRALLAGDKKTGVTIMQMDAGLDTGDILKRVDLRITRSDTSKALHDVLADMGAKALVEVVDIFADDQLPVTEKQDNSRACYAHKLEKVEAEIDWRRDAVVIERMVRAFNPWPVAFTLFQGRSLRVWRTALSDRVFEAAVPGEIVELSGRQLSVACGDKRAISLLEIQPAGKKLMSIDAFLNTRRAMLRSGVVLGG